MSHHFDTKLAKKDPSMNICDMYLFPGSTGNTVMAMTVNADAGLGLLGRSAGRSAICFPF